MLARLARVDPKLLSPIVHRKQESYPDMIQLKARDLLVKNRTRLMNAVRGVLKSAGLRLSPCGTSCFPSKAAMCVPDELKPSLTPLLETISHLNKQIYSLDKAIESTAQTRYPETIRLRQISGVGPITALQYVLMIGDPNRFSHSRDVPAYLGLTPRRHQSGSVEQQLRISKAGNKQLRSLLVQCAQYLLGVLVRTVILSAGVPECSNGAGKTARNGQSWPWLGNLQFYSTACGLPVIRTILFITSARLP